MSNPYENKYVVIVDPYSSGNLYAAEFKKFSCKLIAVMTAPEPPEVYANSFKPDDFDEIFVASDMSIADLAYSLNIFHPIYICAGCESGVELADKIAPLLPPRFFNDPSLAIARRDKWLMAQAVMRSGAPVMKQICSSDFLEVQSWALDNNLSDTFLVVKPPKSASTDGVVKVHGLDGLEFAFNNLLNKKNRLGILNDKVLVQEYLSGVEYVVDTFSYDGVHTVCSVCRYGKLSNINGMAIYERLDWLDPEAPIVEVLSNYAMTVLSAVGISWGSAHIEIMHTANGPRLIELAARPHGGGHPRLCYSATGDSTIHRTVRYFVNRVLPPSCYRLIENMSVVFFRAERASVVVGVDRLKSLAQLPSFSEAVIRVADGDFVPATVDLFGTLAIGFVVLKNKCLVQLESDALHVRHVESLVFQPASSTFVN